MVWDRHADRATEFCAAIIGVDSDATVIGPPNQKIPIAFMVSILVRDYGAFMFFSAVFGL